MKRQPGWYRVLLESGWEFAQWCPGDFWMLVGSEEAYQDINLKEIDENPISPEP